MNIIFGIAGQDNSQYRERAKAYLTAELGVQEETSEHAQSLLGFHSDGGRVCGSANDGTLTLAYLGTIFPPVEGWSTDNSTLDNPDDTAAFLLSLYKEIGDTFLNGMNGQFTVAIHDSKNGELRFTSDPLGGRSFYIYRNDGLTLVSSNIGLLSAMLGDKVEINKKHEDFMLLYGFYPSGTTVYQDIHIQKPGEIVITTGQKSDIASVNPPAHDDLSDLPQTADDAIEALYEVFLSSTRAMLPSPGTKVAVLLGGFDSALVAALIHKLGYEVETYSFYYSESSYNQPHTDTLVKQLGIKHHWIDISRDVIEAGMERFAKTFNQPTNWPNYVIQTALLCERIREDGIEICYSGDGCDAVFLGYPGTYRRARVVNALPSLPKPVHKALVSLAARPSAERKFGHPYRVTMGLLRGLSRSSVARDFLSFRTMDELTLEQLHKDPSYQVDAGIEQLVEDLAASHEALPTMRRAFLGKAAVSPNRSKMLASADMTGVPILSPYMHPDLKRLAVSLPVNLMRPGNGEEVTVTGKFILMRMAEDKGLLDPEIIHQPKMAAVDAPVDDWYAGPMRGVMKQWLGDLPFEQNDDYIDRLLDEKGAENLFKKHIMTDKVISHAPSLLATYSRFAAAIK
ncbi:MAG: asparagine synthase-related protein [Parasphingorhabdus sp.]